MANDVVGGNPRRPRPIVSDRTLNKAATLTFTVDGDSDAARFLVSEMETDVIAWRWDDVGGYDVPHFRGIVAQSEDEVTADSHSVVFTCHSYESMLDRRYLPVDVNYPDPGTEQDAVVSDLVRFWATTELTTSSGVSLMPGSYLPLRVTPVGPDGTTRGATGRLRTRAYTAQSSVGQLVSESSPPLSTDTTTTLCRVRSVTRTPPNYPCDLFACVLSPTRRRPRRYGFWTTAGPCPP